MNAFRNLVERAGAKFVMSCAAAMLATVTLAMALTIPPTVSPRQFPTQQTHYARFLVNFNDCVLAGGTCSVKRVAIPYNSFLVRAYQQVTTAFNSATTDTLALATSSGGGQIVAAQNVHAATAGLPLTILAANLGLAATGNGIAQTGANGGFDVWSVYAQTGAAPTAGQAELILEYFAPNDGSCVYVPNGATSPPC